MRIWLQIKDEIENTLKNQFISIKSYFAQSIFNCMTYITLKNMTWKCIARHMKSMENQEIEVWFDLTSRVWIVCQV